MTFNKISIATAPKLTGPWETIGSTLPSGSRINLAGKDVLWVSYQASSNALPLFPSKSALMLPRYVPSPAETT